MIFRAFIPAQPIGKGRAKSGKSGKGHHYTPDKTRRWEKAVAREFGLLWRNRAPLACPVRLDVEAIFARPKRLIWKRKPMPRVRHIAVPDRDNIEKALNDALEKAGVFKNDSIVCAGEVEKWYAAGDEEPGLHVRIETLEEA